MPKILIIESSPNLRESVAQSLRTEGLDVALPEIVEPLLSAVKRHRPELVIFDLDRPEGDGLTQLARLRTAPDGRRLPVVLLADRADLPLVQQLLRLGVRDLLIRGPGAAAAVVARVDQRLGVGAGRGPGLGGIASAGGAPLQGARPTEPRPCDADTVQVKAPPCRPPRAAEPDRPPPMEAALEMLKLLRPVVAKAELLERVDRGVELRALSPIVHQISALAESPQSSVESITRAIKQDPAICVKILKVANSAIYAGSGPVENVHKAVMRIGLGQIRQAVGSLAVVDRFGETALGQRISAQEFWEHSIACGLLASAIAKARGLRDEEVDGCFTAGLLHDVGRVICAGELGDQYAAVLREADRLALPLELLETRMLGAGHAEIAERVLRAWKFPAHLVTPIALHHLSLGTLRSTAPRAIAEAATLSLANRLAHCLMLGQSGNDTVHPGRDLAAALSLTPETIARICAEVPEQTADLKLALLARGGGNVDRKEPEWMGLLPPKKDLRLAYLSTQPVLDGLGLLCQRLGPRQDQEAPTTAVMYVANVKEQEPLLAELGEMEQEHGVSVLPVVVLSGGGNMPLDPRLGHGRPCVQLPTPVHLRRLAAALRSFIGGEPGVAAPDA